MRTRSLIVCVVAAAACNIPRPPSLSIHDPPNAYEKAAIAIDQLKWYVDAYGGAGMSSPLLVQPDSSFKFNLSLTADQFFALEKDQISGKAAGAVTSAQVFGASLSGAADLTAMQQYTDALAAYQQNQRIVAQKEALLNEAARRDYQAALVAARQLQDPVARATAEADAARKFAQALSGPAADATLTPPTLPAPPGLPGVASVPNAAAGLLPALAASQALFATGTPGVSGETRAATLMAAGDVATSAMLSALLDPSKLSSFSGKQVLWGVSMVAVNPGWKTRKDYSADLQGDIRYTWEWARPDVRSAFLAQTARSPLEVHALAELQRCVVDSLPYAHDTQSPGDLCDDESCEPPSPFRGTSFAPYVFRGTLRDNPIVAAASPMGDAQALDLQASSRSIRQTALQIALALTTAGFNAQASAFLNFAKSKQLDLETRTNNIVVSAYSSTGGFFGFKFNPRLVADPRSGGERDLLQVPTFPTLLIIGMNGNEVHARVLIRRAEDGDEGANRDGASRGGERRARCFVVEPKLQFHTTSRWTRTGEQCQARREHANPCHREELTEVELLRVAEAANEAITEAEAQSIFTDLRALKSDAKSLDKAARELERRSPAKAQATTFASLLSSAGIRTCKGVVDPRGCLSRIHEAVRDLEVKADYADQYVKVLANRKEQLLFLVAGNSQAIWLPPEIVVPPPDKPAKPAITVASPTLLDLEYGEHGLLKEQPITMTIAGNDLDQVDTSKVASPGPMVTAKLVDKTLQLTFSVSAPGTYVFVLPLKDGSALATPPLLVRAPSALLITRTVTDKDGAKDSTTKQDTLMFSPGTPADIVKSEIEKTKLIPTSVKLDVEAGAHTTTKENK